MTETYAPDATENGTNGVKEVRTIRIKFPNGNEWSAPADVIRAMFETMWAANSALCGTHLLAALSGDGLPVPKTRKPRGNGEQ